jgi:two-component system, NtrC family, nitrogen regulation sensor histidine kinase NtrY
MKPSPALCASVRVLVTALPLLVAFVLTNALPGRFSQLHLALVGLVAFCMYSMLAWTAHTRTRARLGTVASVLTGYREGDFSTRVRAMPDALLSEVFAELNQLGETLRTHRLGELEAWALLRKVMAEVDVIVLAFDERSRIRLANAAACTFLGKSQAAIVGAAAADLGIEDLLVGTAPRTVTDLAPRANSEATSDLLRNTQKLAWELRRGGFRLSGMAHTLVVLSDLSAAMRVHEREAWQRLMRVMGHEINNSLAPIQSIAESLQNLTAQTPLPEDWAADLRSGLAVIERRALGLNRFMGGYASLAKLPTPTLSPIDIASCMHKVATLEQRMRVRVTARPKTIMVQADADQLEQAMINLLKNAVEASLERHVDGNVAVHCSVQGSNGVVEITDDGHGLSDTANLFVPFFTTKAKGSGIGLVFAQAIVEAQRGELRLTSRTDAAGAIATVRLPRAQH